ncbi:MAG: hypothetical protein ACLPTZ_04560 [Beijerinckiaceae bacterium]
MLQRQAALNTDCYAADRRIDKKRITDPGFADWTFQTIDFDLARPPKRRVSIEPRALHIHLPQSLTPLTFEKLLRTALNEIALASWLKTPDAQAHFKGLGVDPTDAERYTSYKFGQKIRVSRADEIYIFRQRADMPRLCQLIETIVFEYMRD